MVALGDLISKRRVLVVDDYPDAAESLAEVLRLHDHVVRVAYDGQAALAIARAWLPDVVLCETWLPGLSGYALAKTLRDERNAVRLVALSAHVHPGDVQMAIDAGFDAHVAKPAALDTIEALFASTTSSNKHAPAIGAVRHADRTPVVRKKWFP